MVIDNKLYAEINEYCEINEIEIYSFINKLLREAFLKEKYGESPFNNILHKEPLITKDVSERFVKVETIKEEDIEKNKSDIEEVNIIVPSDKTVDTSDVKETPKPRTKKKRTLK